MPFLRGFPFNKNSNRKEGAMPCNLLLHCGAHAVPRSELAATPTPAETRTWQPIPHEAFVHQVEDLLPGYGLRVANQAHALTHDNARYFG